MFLEFVFEHTNSPIIKCPCSKCGFNAVSKTLEVKLTKEDGEAKLIKEDEKQN